MAEHEGDDQIETVGDMLDEGATEEDDSVGLNGPGDGSVGPEPGGPGVPGGEPESPGDNGSAGGIDSARNSAGQAVNAFTTVLDPGTDQGHSFGDEVEAQSDTHKKAVGEEGEKMSSIVDIEDVRSFRDSVGENVSEVDEGRQEIRDEAENVVEAAERYSSRIADKGLEELEEGAGSEEFGEDVAEDFREGLDSLFIANVGAEFYGDTVVGVNNETPNLTEQSLLENRENMNSAVNRHKKELEDLALNIGSALGNAYESLATYAEIYSEAEEFVEENVEDITGTASEAVEDAHEIMDHTESLVRMRSNHQLDQEEQREEVNRLMDADIEGYLETVSESEREAIEALTEVRDVAGSLVREQFESLEQTLEAVNQVGEAVESGLQEKVELMRALNLTNEEVYQDVEGLGEARARDLKDLANDIEGDDFRPQSEGPGNVAALARLDAEDLEAIVSGTEYEDTFRSADYSDITEGAREYVKEIAGEFGLDSKPTMFGSVGRTLAHDEDMLKVHLMEAAYNRYKDIASSVRGYAEELEQEISTDPGEIIENLGQEPEELEGEDSYEQLVKALEDEVYELGDPVDLEEARDYTEPE